MRKIFLLLCFWAIIDQYAIAQNSRPFSIPSPNTTDLGRYGDIPVSPYTGQPNISIPLYDFTIRGVRLPVTLNYQATGVMMNSLPGWTGHNWVLSAGGCITRLANGRHDEYIYPETMDMSYYDRRKNYFHTYSTLQPSLFTSTDPNDYKWLTDSIRYEYTDLEADIFSFNFMGISGKFFLGNDGEWKVYSDANIEVIFDIEDSGNYIDPFINKFPNPQYQQYSVPKVIKGFILRDENGTQYHFGGSQDCIEYSIGIFDMSDREIATSWLADTWYLKKVEDRHGNTLYSFNYVRGKFITHIYNMFESIFLNESGVYCDPGIGHGDEAYTSNSSFPYNARVISPVYLTGIGTMDNRNLQFYSENIDKPMSDYYVLPNNFYYQIQQIVGIYTVCPCYYLQTNDSPYTTYQYNSQNGDKLYNPLLTSCLRKLTRIESFTSGVQGLSYYFKYYLYNRIQLSDLSIYGENDGTPTDNSNLDSYHFTYNKTFYLPSDYLTKSIDPWGYYTDHVDRTPNDTCAQYGMLTQIRYPTGGVTSFTYELNDYSSVQSDDRQTMVSASGVAGGLRIKSITDYDNSFKTKILRHRDYRYKIPGTNTSSGELFAMPRFSWNWEPKAVVPGASVLLRFARNTSIIPLSNSFGPHIGYTYVEEMEMDDTKRRYHYTNISDAKDFPFVRHFSNSLPTPFDKFGERGYKRGKLLDLSIYYGTLLAQKTEYTYRTDNIEEDYVLCSNIKPMNFSGYASFIFYAGGVYQLFYPKYDVIQEKTTTYCTSGNNVDIKNYQKADISLTTNYNNLVSIRKTLSESLTRGGNVITKSYTYPFDYNSGIEAQLATNEFYLPAIITEESYNNQLTYKRHTLFQNIQNMLLPRYELEWNKSTVADTVMTYTAYTATGAVHKYKELGLPETELIWTNNDNSIEEIRTGGHITTCEYYGHLPYIITQPNGNYLEYEYDDRLRLSNIYDRNGQTKQQFMYHYRNQ